MKRIDFFLNGEPVPGGSVEAVGVVTHDPPVPRMIPLRYNDGPIQLPLINGSVRLNIDFLTPDTVTLSPAEGWEGNQLVIEATAATVDSVVVPIPTDVVVVDPEEPGVMIEGEPV